MKPKPILFSTAMVKAILNGTKTQTRRIIKDNLLQKLKDSKEDHIIDFLEATITEKYKLGQILWVRETFSKKDDRLIYRANVCSKYDLPNGFKWKPSIFMPKDACRLFLEITNIRVERLNKINRNDAIAEGIETKERHNKTVFKNYLNNHLVSQSWFRSPIFSFISLWNSINGNYDDNPYVYVIEFKQVGKPDNF